MPPRIFVDRPDDTLAWCAGLDLDLPGTAARHVQVLRLQPGSELTLFDGRGGQWLAQVTSMTRSGVRARLMLHQALERELPLSVTLAVCMPANDRMDDLVEKATELGVTAIAPLMSERSVLRLQGERALRKQTHWQAVAAAACEQCGRNRVPTIHPVQRLEDFLRDCALEADEGVVRWQLSLTKDADFIDRSPIACAHIIILSGPEGGLSEAEQVAAEAAGHRPMSLGPRTLRADTAPLAALAAISVLSAHNGAAT